MFGTKIHLTREEKERVQCMDIHSFTVYLFRHLKEYVNTESMDSKYDYRTIKGLGRSLFPVRGGSRHDISNEDHFKLSEAIAYLERRRLLVRVFECPENTTGGPVICLTDIGRKSDIDDAVLLLVDAPEEIVAKLEHRFGKLDDVVRQYYLESIRAYREELYISSVICLGAASERAIHWLTEAIIGVCPLETQEEIQKIKNRSINTLTDYLCDEVICNISDYDKRFTNKLLERLNGLARLYRENRNEAGHPQSIEQSWLKDDQEILLLHFRRYVATISEAIRKVVP